MSGIAAGEPDLGALRAAVYQPGATGADVAALQRALDALEPEASPASPPPAVAVPGPAEPEPSARRRLPGRWWAALAAVSATAVGCAAGAALVLLARPGGASTAAVPTTVHIGTTAGTVVLERPQEPIDRPGVPLAPGIVPGSLRRLLTAGSIELYAAQDVRGRRCLVGVQGGAVMSCAAPTRFRRSGLRLLWSSDVLSVDSVGLRELRFRLSLVADWRPDGAVTMGVARE